MKYIFFGGQESPFAQIILDGLKSADWQPLAEIRNAKKSLNISYLKSLGADFFLVASFGAILKKEILNIKPIIGVHPSLLPRLRGPSPIQSAILNDEKETGATLFLIDEKVDHGPILSNVKCQMTKEDTYATLLEKLANLSMNLISDTIPKWLNGKITPKIQDESAATYTKKFITEDAFADLKKDNPKLIWLKTKALNPEPGAWTIVKLKNGRSLRLKLLEADFINNQLQLRIVQPEGKKPMSYKAFLNGYLLPFVK